MYLLLPCFELSILRVRKLRLRKIEQSAHSHGVKVELVTELGFSLRSIVRSEPNSFY